MNEVKRQRLEKQLLRLIADLYFKELKDPAIGFVTFTSCSLTSDGSLAKVSVSIFEEDSDKKKKSLQALNNAGGFIKFRIGRNLKIKVIPNFKFIIDDSLKKIQKINDLIDGIER